jgi:uncharacterized membrane protein
MDIAVLSNTLLEIFYMMVGLYMGITMIFTLKDTNHKTRIGTATFWGILSLVFLCGKYLPNTLVGILVIIIALLSLTKQINVGTIKQLDETFTQLKADKLGLRIFIPSLSIATIAAYSIIYRFIRNCSYRYLININININVCNN